jgi:site-specific DNA-methyltransferase (cytosine-N4-specific)
MEIPINTIINGDALEVLKTFPDESINCVVCSPPYWALRDYGESVKSIFDGDENCEHNWNSKERKLHSGTTKSNISGDNSGHLNEATTTDNFCSKCNAWKGQLGLEPTFDLYIKHLCDIFDEVKRVLRKDGTCWVNLGDSYLGSNQGYGQKEGQGSGIQSTTDGYFVASKNKTPLSNYKLQAKSLALIPFRFAIEMCNRGWLIRNDIVWYKRNSMPSSVKDRFANKWEHVFLFVKNKKYYFDLDSVRKPHKISSINRINAGFSKAVSFNYRVRESVKNRLEPKFGSKYKASEEEQKNYKEKGIPEVNPKGGNPGDFWDITTKPFKEAHFAVYPERLCETPIRCGCPEQGLVLDPFIGAGTTGLVALKQNKKFIGIELNKNYIEIANKRLKPFLEQQKLGDINDVCKSE